MFWYRNKYCHWLPRMQRLAHSHRHVPYQTCSSAVRFSSVQTNPEPFKHSFMSVESFEDPQGTQGDREQTSFRHRGIPKASNLGNVSIRTFIFLDSCASSHRLSPRNRKCPCSGRRRVRQTSDNSCTNQRLQVKLGSPHRF